MAFACGELVAACTSRSPSVVLWRGASNQTHAKLAILPPDGDTMNLCSPVRVRRRLVMPPRSIRDTVFRRECKQLIAASAPKASLKTTRLHLHQPFASRFEAISVEPAAHNFEDDKLPLCVRQR